MNRITGHLRVRETDRPAKDLTVHVYLVGERQVPASIMDDSKWDALFNADWKGLDAVRIGSANSDVAGQFVLDYDPEALPRVTRDGTRLNLWLAVTGADLASAYPCPKVVYASCDIRIGAGEQESFLIHLDERRLRRLGLIGGVPQIRRDGLSASAVLGAIEAVAAAVPKPDLDGIKFSRHFNERHEKRAQEMADAGVRPRKQAQFTVPVAMAAKSEDQPRLSIKADDQRGRLMVHSQSNPGGKPLIFKGIRRQTAVIGVASVMVEVDDESGAFELALANVPDTLKLDQADPLALWVPAKPT
jgi:hypothetical protein